MISGRPLGAIIRHHCLQKHPGVLRIPRASRILPELLVSGVRTPNQASERWLRPAVDQDVAGRQGMGTEPGYGSSFSLRLMTLVLKAMSARQLPAVSSFELAAIAATGSSARNEAPREMKPDWRTRIAEARRAP